MERWKIPKPADPVLYVVDRMADLGDTDLRVALALAARYPGSLPASVSALMRDTGRGRGPVTSAVDRLAEDGVAEWVEVGKVQRIGLCVDGAGARQAPLEDASGDGGAGGPTWTGEPSQGAQGAQAELFGALAGMLGKSTKSMSRKSRMAIAAAARRIRKAGGDAELVRGPVAELWARDWRGRKGSRPTISQVEDLVGVALEARGAPGDTEAERDRKRAWREAMAEWLAGGGAASGKPKPARLEDWKGDDGG